MTYTCKQAAANLGLALSTIYYHIDKGNLEMSQDRRITQNDLDQFKHRLDPDAQLWRDIKAWVDNGGKVSVGNKGSGQLALALTNRVKTGGHRLGATTARKLGVSKERVRYLLHQARLAYAESIISRTYDNSESA